MALFVSALIIGVFLGTIYGLMAFGMVASYRISRVVNLGQAGIAALGATVYYWMTAQWGAPVIVSLIGAILVGALVGGFMGWCNLLMADWPKGFVISLSRPYSRVVSSLSSLKRSDSGTAICMRNASS